MDFITMKEAMQLIDKKVSVNKFAVNDLVFATANRSTKTGGDFIRIDKAVKIPSKTRKDKRLIKHLYGDQIIEIHIDLLLFINGRPIR